MEVYSSGKISTYTAHKRMVQHETRVRHIKKDADRNTPTLLGAQKSPYGIFLDPHKNCKPCFEACRRFATAPWAETVGE